mmetsp:Transcript_29841/g.50799  ORF Transcript_29841/g.50799 Transcript_29841/m.50799 type:complete len:420 (-) Transcript_29841:133-1392(-)|eukprot:CAMPEP_0183743200 /NCGR_PEP_ID=MMETSP0737-20130205/65094_1 /TAXON_ID=385413 /ORGANISM="Thalassiosira miniscula, Strain CCMP1093" /LENGTH=419 /DNA_ID=CAMNT_0025978809 /DNA_START=2323 /DNA_END=3582 /DNA_ORIENTATION=+
MSNPIHYSKWDKFELSDDDDESSNGHYESINENSRQSKTPFYDYDRLARARFALLDPPEKKTHVRRTIEYDMMNLTTSDIDELGRSEERLVRLNKIFPIGSEQNPTLPTEAEMDFDACYKLYRDIKKNKDFWLEELFHPLECHRDPSYCERAVIALCFLSKILYEQQKYQKSMNVADLLTEVIDCYHIQVFENRLFPLVCQSHPLAKELKKREMKLRYRSLEHRYHFCRHNVASMLGIRGKSLESCRKCTEIELTQDFPINKGVHMVYWGSGNPFVQLLELRFGKLTIARFRNEITDDQIWDFISRSTALAARESHEIVYRHTKMCPICGSRKDLTLCYCGTVAYCHPAHRFHHWERHKQNCKCAYCGASSKKLKLCKGCHLKAFCCKDHQLKYWPEHKAECKEAQKSNPFYVCKKASS